MLVQMVGYGEMMSGLGLTEKWLLQEGKRVIRTRLIRTADRTAEQQVSRLPTNQGAAVTS